MLYLYIGSFALHWLFLSTYWDWLFDYDNFYAHGFGVGLAILPFAWVGIAWWIILLRALVLGVCMGVWSDWIKTDWIEEMGRGAFIVITLPILLI